MSATQNKELLQQIFGEMAKGNSRPLVESMADDFSWTISGTTKWSRIYASKQAVLNELFATPRSHMADRINEHRSSLIALLLKVIWLLSSLGQQYHEVRETIQQQILLCFSGCPWKLKEVTEYADTLLITKVFDD